MASSPASCRNSAAIYYRTAVRNTAPVFLTRSPLGSTAFIILLTRDTGNVSPALSLTPVFPPTFVLLAPSATLFLETGCQSRDPRRDSALVRWWTWAGGALWSTSVNRCWGIRFTVSIMVTLLKASCPLRSLVSRMTRLGNRVKTCSRYPEVRYTGLLMRSSCIRCFRKPRFRSCYTFSMRLAPSINVWMCLEARRCTRSSPFMLLKTKSSLIRLGRAGKFSRDSIAQSFNVSICKFLYFSSSVRMLGVK